MVQRTLSPTGLTWKNYSLMAVSLEYWNLWIYLEKQKFWSKNECLSLQSILHKQYQIHSFRKASTLTSFALSFARWINDAIKALPIVPISSQWRLLTVMHAAAAKSLQSCLILCNPIGGSPPGSPIPGILQARTLEWVAISFCNAWKWKVKVKSLSRVRLFVTPWTVAHQAPLSMGFSRQEYWSGLPFLSPCDAWGSLIVVLMSAAQQVTQLCTYIHILYSSPLWLNPKILVPCAIQ